MTRESLGENVQAECFDASDRFIACSALSQDTGDLRNLGDPPSIVLLLGFDRECHKERYWIKRL